METTIAAISTPRGTGGVGIVRVSGPDAFLVAERVFRPDSGRPVSDMAGYTCALGRVFDGETPFDDAICTVFCAPKSYTGENVAEISCHGGDFILERVLRLCLENGAQPAAPGEFTKRAFLNGKLNLTQAEAVMDLIAAQGKSAAKAALAALDGALSAKTGQIVNALLEQSAHLAAWADFPDEDLEELDRQSLSGALKKCSAEITELLATYDNGKILRTGVAAAIVGRPNVGKSTLMNLMAGEDRSIVTDIPGTTRDVVEDSVRIGECVLRLSDTAGIRETDDPVEQAGVTRARGRIEQAELILAVFDSADELNADDRRLLDLLDGKPCIAVINKIDLPTRLDISEIKAHVPEAVTISAKSGEGRAALEEAINRVLKLGMLDPTAAIVANERQRQCLAAAEDSLLEAQSALLAENMLDAVGACVDFALDKLLELTGERASQRVVDEVFARFCVGK